MFTRRLKASLLVLALSVTPVMAQNGSPTAVPERDALITDNGFDIGWLGLAGLLGLFGLMNRNRTGYGNRTTTTTRAAT